MGEQNSNMRNGGQRVYYLVGAHGILCILVALAKTDKPVRFRSSISLADRPIPTALIRTRCLSR